VEKKLYGRAGRGYGVEEEFVPVLSFTQKPNNITWA